MAGLNVRKVNDRLSWGGRVGAAGRFWLSTATAALLLALMGVVVVYNLTAAPALLHLDDSLLVPVHAANPADYSSDGQPLEVAALDSDIIRDIVANSDPSDAALDDRLAALAAEFETPIVTSAASQSATQNRASTLRITATPTIAATALPAATEPPPNFVLPATGTRVSSATKTPRPTQTQRTDQPTQKPKPTKEPTPTAEPKPSHEPNPTPEPRPTNEHRPTKAP